MNESNPDAWDVNFCPSASSVVCTTCVEAWLYDYPYNECTHFRLGEVDRPLRPVDCSTPYPLLEDSIPYLNENDWSTLAGEGTDESYSIDRSQLGHSMGGCDWTSDGFWASDASESIGSSAVSSVGNYVCPMDLPPQEPIDLSMASLPELPSPPPYRTPTPSDYICNRSEYESVNSVSMASLEGRYRALSPCPTPLYHFPSPPVQASEQPEVIPTVRQPLVIEGVYSVNAEQVANFFNIAAANNEPAYLYKTVTNQYIFTYEPFL